MPYILDDARWNAIESLPLPSGVGDPKHGLCAVALDGDGAQVKPDAMTCERPLPEARPMSDFYTGPCDRRG